MTNRVPQNWEKVRIGDVTESFGGTTPFTQEPKYWKKGTIPWATPTDVTSLQNKYISFTKSKISQIALKETALKLLDVGDILMTSRATIGYPAIATKSICTNQGFINIICSHRISNIYMFYWIEKNRKYMQRYAQGSTFLEINKKDFRKIEILLPPLPEQCQIAAILSIVDDAIEKTDTIIEETMQLKKGLVQKLFAEGIGHKRFKETKIGRIPEAWSVLPAELICEKVTDGTHDTPKPVIQGYPLVTSKNLKDGKLNFNGCYNISKEDFIEVNKRSKVDQYDVLYGMIGTIGSPVIILDKDVSYAVKNVGIFKTDTDIELGRWLVHFFNSSLSQKFIERQKNGTTQSFVPLGLLRKFPIPMPSNDERLEINRILSEVDNKIEKEEATKEQLEQLKKGLMQVLLTGKVRVKV